MKFKKIIALCLATSMISSIIPTGAFASTQENHKKNYVLSSFDKKENTSYEELKFSAVVDNQSLNYQMFDYHNGDRKVIVTSKNERHITELKDNGSKLYFDGKLIFNSNAQNNFPSKLKRSYASPKVVYSISQLTWKSMGIANYEVSVAAAAGTIAGTAAIIAVFTPAKKEAVVKGLALIAGLSTIVNANSGTIYFKLNQYSSNEMAQISDMMATRPQYMYRHDVRFYKDGTYSTALTPWSEGDPFYASKPY